MKAVRFVLICILLPLLAGVALAGSTLPPAPDFLTTLATDHFYLKYNPDGNLPMTPTLDGSMAAYEKVDAFFQGSFRNKTTLEVAYNNNEFRILTGIGDVPDNSTALDFNEGPRGTVVIKSPLILPDFTRVLTYHMARIAERTMLAEYHNPPEWFQDGLAAYVASDMTPEQRAVAEQQAKGGQWRTLPELEAVSVNKTVYNENSAEVKAARGQAFLLIEAVGNTYGNRTLVAILADFGDGGNLSQSFVNKTGKTPDKFNSDLKNLLLGPVTETHPTPVPEEKEYVSGYLRDEAGNPLANEQITFSGSDFNTTVNSDTKGYYAAEVSFGVLNVSIAGKDFNYRNTVPVNMGENKVFNITITGTSRQNQALIPALALPGLPSLGQASNLVAGVVILIADLLAILAIAWVLKRNL